VLSIGKLGRGSEDYYLSVVASGVEDYYLGSGEAPGVWLGAGVMTLAELPQGCSSEVPILSGGEGSCSEVAACGLAQRVGAGVVAA
jgi:hypothetical protein